MGVNCPVMPRYYFSIENGIQVRGEYGEDLPDDEAVRAMALLTARDLAKNGGPHKHGHVVVRNQSGEVVCEVLIGD